MDLKALAPLTPDTSKSTALLESQAKHAKNPNDIKKAATQFEGLLVQQMLKSMWATVPHEKGSITGSHEEEMYRDMFQEALATQIAEHSSLGIADVVARDMKQIEARTHPASSKSETKTATEAEPRTEKQGSEE